MTFENKYSSYKAVNDIKETKQDVVSVWLNQEERDSLERMKAILQQEKDATAIKQLVAIASKLIDDTPEGLFFRQVLDNLRKNKRLGIVEVEPKNKQN